MLLSPSVLTRFGRVTIVSRRVAAQKPSVTIQRRATRFLSTSGIRALYSPSFTMRYPILTKENVDPKVMEPMQPVEEELLDDQTLQEEKHMLEHDLEEEDFEDRDDDDLLLPEEHVNPTTGERGGPKGYEPTRFGDWSKNGRVSDF